MRRTARAVGGGCDPGAAPLREHLNSAKDTEALGARLAHSRPDAYAPLAVVYLRGTLGAGKTTLAQGFLRACGVSEVVHSPTYTLVHLYPVGAQTVLHVDLYRLQVLEELEHLGLSEWALPGHVWLVEWPERGAAGLPPADLLVELSIAGQGHEAHVTAGTDAGEAWLRRLATRPKRSWS